MCSFNDVFLFPDSQARLGRLISARFLPIQHTRHQKVIKSVWHDEGDDEFREWEKQHFRRILIYGISAIYFFHSFNI